MYRMKYNISCVSVDMMLVSIKIVLGRTCGRALYADAAAQAAVAAHLLGALFSCMRVCFYSI